MTEVDQRALVSDSLTGGLPRRWPRRRYVVTTARAAPVIGECITTRPGAYWRVDGVTMLPVGYELSVSPLCATSLETHGEVRYEQGGVLL